jgi:hypothetical protein
MKKLVMIIVFLFLLTFAIQAQETFTEVRTKGGTFYKLEITDIDSAESFTTEWLDISAMDNQTIYFTGEFDGATNDSIRIIVEAKFDSDLTAGTDTIYYKADNFTQTAYSPAHYVPYIRLVIIGWNTADGTTNDGDITDDAILYLGLYTKLMDVMETKKSYQDLY